MTEPTEDRRASQFGAGVDVQRQHPWNEPSERSTVGTGAPGSQPGGDVLHAVVAPPRGHRKVSVFVAAYLALLCVTGSLLLIRGVFFGPDDTVKSYLSALAARDGEAALATLSLPDGPPQPLLGVDIVRASAYKPPDLKSIDDVTIDHDQAQVNTTFLVDGREFVHQFVLTREKAMPWRAWRPWRIVEPTAQLQVGWPYGDRIDIAGLPFRAVEGGFASSAFVGGYLVTADPDDPLFSSPTVVVVAGAGDEVVALSPEVKPEVTKAVDAGLAGLLKQCAQIGQLQTEGCPSAASNGGYGQVSSVRWHIDKRPTYNLAPQPKAVQMEAGSPGRATVRYSVADGYGGKSQYHESVEFEYPLYTIYSGTNGTLQWNLGG